MSAADAVLSRVMDVGAPSPPPSLVARALDGVAAGLVTLIVALLLGGVLARYIFSVPVIWIDEVVSIAFLWLAMVGAVIASMRHEHLRLALFSELASPGMRTALSAFAATCVAGFLLALIPHAVEYTRDEWSIASAALGIPNSFRVAAIPFGMAGMLLVALREPFRSGAGVMHVTAAVLVFAAAAGAAYVASPWLQEHGGTAMTLFLGGVVALCLVAGVPIAFCFGLGVLGYLAFGSQAPLGVIVGRMDEGMSGLILVSVPIFVLLGCVLDATGMGKAIVDFLAALVGHVKAGMSYVLLGSLFIVSGISGSKVSDMATVAPALFPEMKRRGNKPAEMVALLATGAAMADTVPPSIVLIVLGSVAGVSIAGLFQSGFVVAMVLLMTLLVLARWNARHEKHTGVSRPPLGVMARLLLVSAPALMLPFFIRSLVGGGVATATEVSTIAVLYALLVGHLLYGGITARKLYRMTVDTAALSGAILLILGTASSMAWAITQSGVVQDLSAFLTSLPGGPLAFLGVTIVVFLVLGCVLEGLPAVLLLAPIMFPVARKLGIHDIHYSMVLVCAMNVGLMMPPIGVGFYLACRIGGESPDQVMKAVWPYLFALLIGIVVIAMVPWISTVAL
jgi:tripartite ATP-independent transporter DctM subunit